MVLWENISTPSKEISNTNKKERQDWKIKQIIAEEVGWVFSEMSRRKKAKAALNGSNNNIRTMAILTSENPCYDISSDCENVNNADRRENLEKDLKLGHYAWFPVKGQYEGKENSYIVYNISLDNALHLGRKFEQESIIFIEDGLCQYWEQRDDGRFTMTHEREMHQRLDMTNADNYYTQVSRDFKFQFPFFDGSDENRETMNESIRYVDRVIKSHVKDLNEAQRRIDTTLTATSGYNRFCNRGQLYGKCFDWSEGGESVLTTQKNNTVN